LRPQFYFQKWDCKRNEGAFFLFTKNWGSSPSFQFMPPLSLWSPEALNIFISIVNYIRGAEEILKNSLTLIGARVREDQLAQGGYRARYGYGMMCISLGDKSVWDGRGT